MANNYGYLQDENGNYYIPAIPGSEYLAMNGTKLINYDGSYIGLRKDLMRRTDSGECVYRCYRSDTGTAVRFGIGSGGINHRDI